jgi:transcriptional regulator with XRE-family HTH domain
MDALQDLVTEHMDRTGDTLSDIAARGGLSRQTLSGLMNRHTGDGGAMPRTQTLQALARGLGLPFETVRVAAAVAVYGEGEQTPVRRKVAVLIGYAERLDDESLDVALATLRALTVIQTPTATRRDV